jgi:hypothetical protein
MRGVLIKSAWGSDDPTKTAFPLLRDEGFTDIQYIKFTGAAGARRPWLQARSLHNKRSLYTLSSRARMERKCL